MADSPIYKALEKDTSTNTVTEPVVSDELPLNVVGSDPPTQADIGKFFAKDAGGRVEAHYKDDTGVVTQLTANGAVNGGGGGALPELFSGSINDDGYYSHPFFLGGDPWAASIAWSPELGIAVQVPRFTHSYDGVRWISLAAFQAPTTSSDPWVKIVWCGPPYSRFVAIAMWNGDDYENVVYSSDGIVWSDPPATAFEDDAAGRWSTLVYAPPPYNGGAGLLVSLSDSNGFNFDGFDSKTSADGGLTWAGIVHGLGAGNWREIAFSPELGRFVACGLSGAVAWSNNPAVGWTLATTPPSPSANHYSVAWSGKLGLFVVTADAIDQTYSVATSPDGDTWTTVSIQDPLPRDWRCAVWAADTFVVAAQDSTECLVSRDGVAWFLRPAAQTSHLSQMTYIPEKNRIVAVGITSVTLVSDRYLVKTADIEGSLRGFGLTNSPIWLYRANPGEALSLTFTATCAYNGFPGKAHFVVSALVTIRDGGTVDVQDVAFLNGPFRDDVSFDVDISSYGPSTIVITVTSVADAIWRVHGKLTASSVRGGGDPEA